MKHQDYKEMLPLYALDTLEEAELRELKAHLPTCPQCSVEVDAWRDTTSMLAYAAAPAEPSLELRSIILKNVRTLNRQPAIRKESGLRRSFSEAVTADSKPVAGGSKVVQLRRQSSRLR